MNCLTKLSQKKRMTKSYIRAFLATMMSKLDSSALLLFLFRPIPHYADVKYFSSHGYMCDFCGKVTDLY